MIFALGTFVKLSSVALNRILIPIAIVMALISYGRRHKDIGGWLLYFYYWISVFLLVFVLDVLQNPAAFFTVELKPDMHLALIMATVPRLISIVVLIGAAFFLLTEREWVWVERVRMCLLITAVCAGISVVIDHYYFPGSVYVNSLRLIGLVLWTLYFFVSKRIQAVFLTKTWEAQQ